MRDAPPAVHETLPSRVFLCAFLEPLVLRWTILCSFIANGWPKPPNINFSFELRRAWCGSRSRCVTLQLSFCVSRLFCVVFPVRVSGSVFHVSHFMSHASCLVFIVSCFVFHVSSCVFCVSYFLYRVLWLEIGGSGIVFRVSCIEAQGSGSGIAYRGSSFEVRRSSVVYRVSGIGLRSRSPLGECKRVRRQEREGVRSELHAVRIGNQVSGVLALSQSIWVRRYCAPLRNRHANITGGRGFKHISLIFGGGRYIYIYIYMGEVSTDMASGLTGGAWGATCPCRRAPGWTPICIYIYIHIWIYITTYAYICISIYLFMNPDSLG